MRKINKTFIIPASLCISFLLAGCNEKTSTADSNVQSTRTVSSSAKVISQSDNITDESIISPFQYSKYKDKDLNTLQDLRCINGKQYKFGSACIPSYNTFAIDINNVTVKKLDYQLKTNTEAYIFNDFLYEINHNNPDNSVCIINLNDTSDVKTVTLDCSTFSRLKISPNGNFYFLELNNLYIYDQNLSLIRQTTLDELGIKNKVYDFCCDANENIYFFTDISSDDYEHRSIKKFDSQFNKIFDKTYSVNFQLRSFFINKDGNICIGTVKYHLNESMIYNIDSLSGEYLSEYKIPCDCILLNGTHDYDCTYYTCDNKLYGYKYADKSSTMILDNSKSAFDDPLTEISANYFYYSYSYSDPFLFIASPPSNTYSAEIITDDQDNKNLYWANYDNNKSSIEISPFISSSGDIYFTQGLLFNSTNSDEYKNCKYSVYKMTADGQTNSISIPLPDDFGYTDILAVDDTNNIYIGKSNKTYEPDHNKIELEIFDVNSQYIADACIENVSEIKSYFIFGNYMYIYYLDTNEKNHMVRINPETKNFETVPEFENTNFNIIINGTDEYDLYVVEGTYLHGYSFEKNKYTQLTDNIDMDKRTFKNIYALNKNKFIVEYKPNDRSSSEYFLFEKQK